MPTRTLNSGCNFLAKWGALNLGDANILDCKFGSVPTLHANQVSDFLEFRCHSVIERAQGRDECLGCLEGASTK